MKKLLLVCILFPMLSFSQGAENPPPPMGARATEGTDAGPGTPAPGLPINNSIYCIIGLTFGFAIAGTFFTKYRFEK